MIAHIISRLAFLQYQTACKVKNKRKKRVKSKMASTELPPPQKVNPTNQRGSFVPKQPVSNYEKRNPHAPSLAGIAITAEQNEPKSVSTPSSASM